jgi:hypothetical protein
LDEVEKRTRLEALSRKLRLEYLRGAEEETSRCLGRPMRQAELRRVLERYPGDWLDRPPRADADRPTPTI